MAKRNSKSILVRMPSTLKRRLAREVARRESTLNDVAVDLLADEFGVDFRPSGRRGPVPGDTGVFLLRIPPELKRQLDAAARERRSSTNKVVVETLTTRLGAPTPRKDTMARQNGSQNGKGRDGKVHDDVGMWIYWCLEEGTLGVDPEMHKTNDGRMPPVIHVDTDAPLHSDVDGSLITDKLWGLYYKPDFNFGGVQGGSSPYKVDQDPDTVAVDPYGPDSPDFIVGDNFIHTWCSMLAHCQKRFEGKISLYKYKERSGGLGCFTPDSFPVFDVFRENVYVIADSNHGYKMLGVGKLVAQEIMGEKSALLEPFRFARFEKGELHPTSHSPFPWS